MCSTPITSKVSVTAPSLLSYCATSTHVQLCYRNSSHIGIIIPRGPRTKLLPCYTTSAANGERATPEKRNKLSPEGIYFPLTKGWEGWQADFDTRLQTSRCQTSVGSHFSH